MPPAPQEFGLCFLGQSLRLCWWHATIHVEYIKQRDAISRKTKAIQTHQGEVRRRLRGGGGGGGGGGGRGAGGGGEGGGGGGGIPVDCQ